MVFLFTRSYVLGITDLEGLRPQNGWIEKHGHRNMSNITVTMYLLDFPVYLI